MSSIRTDDEIFGLLKPGYYNLQVGSPNPNYLKRVAECLEIAFNQLKQQNKLEAMLQYGGRAGGEDIRKEVANFLSRQYESLVQWENIFITNGATSGLQFLMRHYFNPDQILFVENPTYPFFASEAENDKLMTTVPIPVESDGLDLNYLERELEKLPQTEVTVRRPYRAAIYLIPTHQNPTGCCYSPEKCERLIKLARKLDLLLICDDVYNVLSYKVNEKDPSKFDPSPARLFTYDRKTDSDYKGNVISNGSFTKIIAPGLRMGWYEAPDHAVKAFSNNYLAISGGGRCCYVSYVVAEALKNKSIDILVQSLKVALKSGMETIIKVVEDTLSSHGVTISHPQGGYFLWVKLPSDVDSARVLEIADTKENTSFVKGNLASICSDFSNCLRLCFAYYEAHELKEASVRLCRSILTAINEKEKL